MKYIIKIIAILAISIVILIPTYALAPNNVATHETLFVDKIRSKSSDSIDILDTVNYFGKWRFADKGIVNGIPNNWIYIFKIDADEYFGGFAAESLFAEKDAYADILYDSSDTKYFVNPNGQISAKLKGSIETSAIKFPDGTIQSTAAALSSGDNLGDHIATNNIQLNNNYLSGDGEDEGIFIDPEGKIGVGTTSPEKKLDVSGSSIRITGNGDTQIEVAAGGVGSSRIQLKAAQDNIVNGWQIIALEESGSTNLRFHHGTPQLELTADGNLGMGTTKPTQKLDIVGKIRLRDAANCGKLFTDNDGNIICGTDAVTDNMGNHQATQNIRLNGRFLSNDGQNKGLRIEDPGTVIASNGLKIEGGNFQLNQGSICYTRNCGPNGFGGFDCQRVRMDNGQVTPLRIPGNTNDLLVRC